MRLPQLPLLTLADHDVRAIACVRSESPCRIARSNARPTITFKPAKMSVWDACQLTPAFQHVRALRRRDTQVETVSPLPMSACMRPSIMNVGET
jgi:hypothetical protein